MRKVLIFSVLLVFLALIFLTETTYANQYTYEGKVDPAVMFNEWTMKDVVNMGNGYFEIEFINPDPKAKIRVGLILAFMPQHLAVAYAYLEGGEPHLFVLTESNCYVAVLFKDDVTKNLFRQRLLKILDGAIT